MTLQYALLIMTWMACGLLAARMAYMWDKKLLMQSSWDVAILVITGLVGLICVTIFFLVQSSYDEESDNK